MSRDWRKIYLFTLATLIGCGIGYGLGYLIYQRGGWSHLLIMIGVFILVGIAVYAGASLASEEGRRIADIQINSETKRISNRIKERMATSPIPAKYIREYLNNTNLATGEGILSDEELWAKIQKRNQST